MQRITSFSVDHDYIVPGMYISRIDGRYHNIRSAHPQAELRRLYG